jgi:predicted transcriptional regulator
MKTYQIQIEDEFFPELKKVLGLLPKNSVRLQTQAGYEIAIEDVTSDFELSDEFDAFIAEGIAELDKGEGIPHEQVVAEMQAKYPDLKFGK